MIDDILERIDDTLTFYSAGLGEELTVPVESRHAPGEDYLQVQVFFRAELAAAWAALADFSVARGGVEWTPEHPCRVLSVRSCPVSYGDVCGDRPCARFESDDETPWLAELERR